MWSKPPPTASVAEVNTHAACERLAVRAQRAGHIQRRALQAEAARRQFVPAHVVVGPRRFVVDRRRSSMAAFAPASARAAPAGPARARGRRRSPARRRATARSLRRTATAHATAHRAPRARRHRAARGTGCRAAAALPSPRAARARRVRARAPAACTRRARRRRPCIRPAHRAPSSASGRALSDFAEELRGEVRQLVRLVDDEGLRAGQDFAEAFLLQREVGQQQVMVDHDHVGGLRALPRLHHEALAPERAFAAEAVLGGRGDHRQQRRILGQRLEFGQVAHAGAPAPGDDALELRDLFARGEARLALGLFQPVLAQVVGAALQQRGLRCRRRAHRAPAAGRDGRAGPAARGCRWR